MNSDATPRDGTPRPLVVLVTGASQGIGLAAAQALDAAGHRVVLAARNQEKLAAAAAALSDRAVAVPADVADPEAVAALFRRIESDHGRLDAVFNNAGVNVAPRDIGDTSFEDWRRVISVNLDGAFLVASAAFALMKRQTPQGGRIVNNGSVSAHAPRRHGGPYTASKHAITGLTKSIALDGRPFRIACGQIDIGNAGSDMTARMAAGVMQADGDVRPEPLMDVRLVGLAVRHMIELPLDANVLFQTLMATNMPLVGRG